MFKLVVLSLLLVSTAQNCVEGGRSGDDSHVLGVGFLVFTDPLDFYSFSLPVGSGTGTGFATSGEGRITAVRVWEQNNNQITGFQLKYGFSWSPIIGTTNINRVAITLFDGEAIVQVSGKYNPSNFIEQVQFVTNRGRFLSAGQPLGLSFNHYPTDSGSELRILSGRFSNAGITSLGVHWGRVDTISNSSALAYMES